MDWTSSDEQLYRALALEQRLSIGGNARPAEDLYGTSFRCTVSEIMLNKREGDTYIWKMPRRWYADPLNPWTLMLLLFWIPANIIYLCFQAIRSLASTRHTWSLPAEDNARLEPRQLSFSRQRSGLSGPIPYTRITSLGYYANGVRIDQGGKKLLLSTEAAPSLFVTLRHFAPNASVAAGLMVPSDFAERCSASGRYLDVTQMQKNPPSTWVAQSKEYKPPLPSQAIIGFGIILILVLLFISLSV